MRKKLYASVNAAHQTKAHYPCIYLSIYLSRPRPQPPNPKPLPLVRQLGDWKVSQAGVAERHLIEPPGTAGWFEGVGTWGLRFRDLGFGLKPQQD